MMKACKSVKVTQYLSYMKFSAWVTGGLSRTQRHIGSYLVTEDVEFLGQFSNSQLLGFSEVVSG
jgi:hypothetical protein